MSPPVSVAVAAIVTVYVVNSARSEEGVNLTCRLATGQLNVPGTAPPLTMEKAAWTLA